MRWIVLALSLGAAIMSMIHGVIAMLLSSGEAAQSAGASGSAFTWLTGILLIVSAVFALIGGILAFNRRRVGGIFLVIAALICLFAHRETRIYGGIYLMGGVLSFFCRRTAAYEDYDDYEEDEDYEEEDEDENDGEREDFHPFSYGRRRERAAKIKVNKEEYDAGGPVVSRFDEPVRVRSSKVCPACGASVGIDHKFCHTCGGPLHTSRQIEEADVEPSSDSSPSPVFLSVEEKEPLREEPMAYREFQTVFPTDSRPETDEEDMPLLDEDEDEADEPGPLDEPVEYTSPHKVFVKPTKDEQPVPKRPLIINPDNSYQEFSNYTRRRKRRNYSLLRRILGPLILLLAVGGTAWFLLGLRKVPEPDLPVPLPDPTPVVQDQPAVAHTEEPENRDVLSMLRVDSPARGVVIGTNVNVRPDHSTAGASIARLNSDARVDILERWEGTSGNLSGPWYRIRFSGREGWVYGQYCQPLDARDATLPAGYTAALLRTFGADKTAITGQLGQPTRQTATTLTWSGLTANLKADGEITRLQATSAKHVLANGVAVGITEEVLYKNVGYPSDYKSGQLRYLEGNGQGMSVRMQNGRVQSISVGNI